MTLNDWIKLQPYGECRRLSRELGVDPSLITHWQKGTRQVPIAHCPAIERATDHHVTLLDLRPDVDGFRFQGRVFVEVL